MHSGVWAFIWVMVGEGGSAATGGGTARSAAAQLAVLGMLVALIGLGALIVWTVLRWLRLRMAARESGQRSKGPAAVSAWTEAGKRAGSDRPATPWPSIANPNLRDPVARMLEDEEHDDTLEETRPMDGDPDLDDTDDSDARRDRLHDTDEEHRWEFEDGGHQADHDDDDENGDEDRRFGDDSIGFGGDDTDDPDDTDWPDRRER